MGRAIEYNEEFLSPWKDADPGMTEVEDAITQCHHRFESVVAINIGNKIGEF